MLSRKDALEALSRQRIFRDDEVPFRLSPSPLALPRALVRELQRLGSTLRQFQRASHQLYLQSTKQQAAPWLAPLLDAGKPAWMIEAQRTQHQRDCLPRIMRPDLLWCEEGLRLTEIDSVPGGLGLLHFLHQLYASAGFADQLIGGADAITRGMQQIYPEGAFIAISEESGDYRPEMQYLRSELPASFGYRAAEELRAADRPACRYRFFELFDHENIPAARDLITAWAQGDLCMDPPPISHLEEKAWLALLHLPGLQEWWRTHLRASHREKLRELIPRSWLLDPTPLPPHASLPWMQINDWRELGQLSQRERRLVIKISGFDERAWGARGVYIGHDMSSEAWRAQLHQAHDDYPHTRWIMQEYCNTAIIEHPYYDRQQDSPIMMKGRVRLCPYYITDPASGKTQLMACLATIVPQDKKKIHGMRDSVIVPCIQETSQS